MLFPTVKEFSKSVNIWWSYCKTLTPHFFEIQCIYYKFLLLLHKKFLSPLTLWLDLCCNLLCSHLTTTDSSHDHCSNTNIIWSTVGVNARHPVQILSFCCTLTQQGDIYIVLQVIWGRRQLLCSWSDGVQQTTWEANTASHSDRADTVGWTQDCRTKENWTDCKTCPRIWGQVVYLVC